jgi:N-acetylated-alpha-linked acidic dipeptidase
VAKAFEEQLQSGNLSKKRTKRLNAKLMALEKSFLDPEGMPYGDWYKSLYASSDPFSGYASWILPGLQYQIEMENKDQLSDWDQRYANAINDLNAKLADIMESL